MSNQMSHSMWLLSYHQCIVDFEGLQLVPNWQKINTAEHLLPLKTTHTTRKKNKKCQGNFLALKVWMLDLCFFQKAAAKELIQTHSLPHPFTYPLTVQTASLSTVQDCAATFLCWAGGQLKKKHQKCNCWFFFNSTSCQNMNVFLFGNVQHWHQCHWVLLQCSTSTF